MGWSTENWKILAGVAFFMLAIRSMEGTIASLSNRKFKLLLKRETGNRFGAAATGALAAAIVQSSSVANLVIIDMAGSGILPLQSALALNLGANLGTTINSWLVSWLGFHVNMEMWILPVTGITGIAMHLSDQRPRIQSVCRLLFSLSLILFSLDFIKSGMGSLISRAPLGTIHNIWLVVLFAITATAIVQASSIIMVLALTALYLQTISFESACALVLGGEIGTTLKLFFAARGLNETKKAMALGNFLFNVITAFFVLIFLDVFAGWALFIAGSTHEIEALVWFQTLFNFLALLLFLPWLPAASAFLVKRKWVSHDGGKSSNTPGNGAAVSVTGLEQEVRNFMNHVAFFMMDAFGSAGGAHHPKVMKGFGEKSNDQQYQLIKQLNGKLHRLMLDVKKNHAAAVSRARIEQLASAARNTMYAAKNIRNITDDIKQFRNSSNDIKFNFFLDASQRVPEYCRSVLSLLNESSQKPNHADQLGKIYTDMGEAYQTSLIALYGDRITDGVSNIEISSLLNCNREIFSAFKSFFYGVMELLLSPEDSGKFEERPGFIR